MNYTTIEQSKKLLELGLKAETADACYDVGYGQIKAHIECENFICYFTNDEFPELKDRYAPCWSLATLLNIINNNDIPYRLRNNRNSKFGYILSVQLINHKGMNDFNKIVDCITMKRQINCLLLGDQYRYIVKTKEHWWNKWHYIYDGRYPRLFALADLIELHLISIEELEKYFKADNNDSKIVL